PAPVGPAGQGQHPHAHQGAARRGGSLPGRCRARAKPRRSTMRRHPGLVVALLAMLGVLVLGAFPVRAYFVQVRHREELAARVRTLQAGNAKLTDQAALLQSDETIERLARERFQLVRPGEEAYAIL